MKKHFLILLTAFATLLGACKGNDPEGPNNPSNPTATEIHTESGMYVGISAFGENVKYYPAENSRYNILNKDNKNKYINFIDQLSVSNGTALFYTIDNNLSYIKNCSFPSDVTNVSIITFTDGLDQGSRGVAKANGQDDEYIKSTSTYLAAIKEKLNNITVPSDEGAIKISAYAIGVRGGDITTDDEVKMFRNNLVSMSSTEKNALLADNMEQVNQKFKEIAQSLYKENRSTTATIILPMPSENVRERFAFDQVEDGAKSQCYIEGVYRNGALEDIKYEKCSSSSGTKVKEEIVGTKIKFIFEKFEVAEGFTFDPKKIVNFKIEEGLSSWQRNSEFKPEEQPDVKIELSSAVIMLNLDCSSSLIDTEKNIDVFKDVKAAAKNFINLLVSADGENSGGGENPGGGGNPTDNDPHCWEVTYTYYGTVITGYGWDTEANVKAMIKELESDPDHAFTNISYRRASANDEYSCEALNPQEGPDPTYYIKHPWGTGADADWEWKQMYKSADYYEYEGYWGGVGANINTTASDNGAKWFPESSIYGADALYVGDRVRFIYVPTDNILYAENLSSNSSNAQIRFKKAYAYNLITDLAIVNSDMTDILASYEFGSGTGTSSYFEFAAQDVHLYAYWLADGNDPEGWYRMSDAPYDCNAGEKYTYLLDEEGISLIYDGTINTPARSQAKRAHRITKSEMLKVQKK